MGAIGFKQTSGRSRVQVCNACNISDCRTMHDLRLHLHLNSRCTVVEKMHGSVLLVPIGGSTTATTIKINKQRLHRQQQHCCCSNNSNMENKHPQQQAAAAVIFLIAIISRPVREYQLFPTLLVSSYRGNSRGSCDGASKAGDPQSYFSLNRMKEGILTCILVMDCLHRGAGLVSNVGSED